MKNPILAILCASVLLLALVPVDGSRGPPANFHVIGAKIPFLIRPTSTACPSQTGAGGGAESDSRLHWPGAATASAPLKACACLNWLLSPVAQVPRLPS